MRISICLFLLINFCTKTEAQFSSTIQNLTEYSSAKMHGISLHDLDADGDLDILATFPDGVILLENKSAANFSGEKNQFVFDLPLTGGRRPARFADLDGDTLPDLAVNKSWRKNVGKGQFSTPVEVFKNPLAALCDVDGDGFPDAIHHNASNLFWQKNTQNGTFSPFSTNIGSGANWQLWAVADLNSDGFQDLVLSRNFRFYWYKNLKNGTFEGIQLDASFPKEAITEDLDGDGRVDLLAGFGNQIRWLKFDSLGAWTLHQAITVSTFQGGLAVGDSDGDGDRDLVAGDLSDNSNSRLRWFLMQPNGLFSTTATGGIAAYPDGYNLNICALGDLNGNGEIDLAVGSSIKENGVSISFNGSIAGSFQPLVLAGLPIGNIRQIHSVDLDLDGDSDLVAANFLLERTGIGQLAPRRRLNMPNQKVQFADLNGDTLPDAVYPFGNSIAWQRNLGNFQFDTQIKLDELIFLAKDVGISDLDNDGDLDLFAACGTDAPNGTAVARWYKNDGAGHFSGFELGQGIKFCNNVFPLDFNEDGRMDLVFMRGAPDSDLWFKNWGGGNFSTAQNFWAAGTLEPDGNLNQKMLIDLNSDGRSDLICCTRDYGIVSVYWYQNLGDGAFSDRKILLNISQNASAGGLFFTVLDTDGDNRLDVVVSQDYARKIVFLKNLGNGVFASAKDVVDDPSGFSGFDAISNYDVDGDGRLDLVFGNANAQNGGKNALSWLGGTGLSFGFEPFQNTDFQVFPNPVSEGQPLQITLENDFTGTVKFEVLSLDGRVLAAFGEEKTARVLNVSRVLNPAYVDRAAFFLRVSDGKRSATRLVITY